MDLIEETERDIYCAGCRRETSARLTDGREIYPHRDDLRDLPFWKCDRCGNYVGCHHKTDHPTRPLGIIPTPELRKARGHIHALLDPLWKTGRIGRRKLYSAVAKELGRAEYHTADIKTVDEARVVYRAGLTIKARLDGSKSHRN